MKPGWSDIEGILAEAADLDDAALEAWLKDAPEPVRSQARVLIEGPTMFGPWAAEAAATIVGSTPRLNVPCTLSHYRVVRRVATGGMGEVYEADDTRLKRKVAIKVLHGGSTRPLDDEAQALARLRHPNICRIYDMGHADGVDYLVMELLDGVPLSDRLRKGPLPLDDALSIGAAIARALGEAHRLGIVHRDVKPANILLTRNGPSLVDFGIAGDAMGVAGILAGTPPYMAPEQARGVCDPRSDIYSIGAVLRETAPQGVPAAVHKVIDACLREEPDERWQSAADLARALEWLSEPARAAAPAPWWRRWWPGYVATALVGLAALAWVGTHRPAPQPRVLVPLHGPRNQPIRNEWEVDVSPDGTRVAFIAADDPGARLIWIRKLDSMNAEALHSTVGASLVFWSPDGESLGFVRQGRMETIHLATGALRTIAQVVGPPLRAIWGRDGQILYATNNLLRDGVIYRIAASGGTPRRVTELNDAEEELRQGYPALLPDGEHFLFVAGSNLMVATQDEPGHTYFASFQQPGSRKLVLRGCLPAGVAGDRFYYVRDNDKTLWSRRINPRTGDWLSEPRRDSDGVSWARVTPTGVILYMPAPPKSRPAWVDRFGRKLGDVPVPEGDILGVGASRDGTLLVSRQEEESAGIGLWVVRDNQAVRLGSGPGRYVNPAWSADGRWIYFAGYDGTGLHRRRPVPGAEEELLLPRNGEDKVIASTTGDGRYGFGVALDARTGRGFDIFRIDLATRERQNWSATKEGETQPAVSPNDQWVAWACEIFTSGRLCLSPIDQPRNVTYLTEFPASEPKWSRDGRELYFASGGWLHAMPFSLQKSRPVTGTPERLFQLCDIHRFGARYAVVDRNRFVLREPFRTPSPPILVWNPRHD